MKTATAGYVYAIQNTVNGGMYIGSSTNYKSRWHTHRSALRRGKHHSFVLQKAWDKHGESAFEFKLLVVCPADQRIEYENRLMPLQRYNLLRTAKECLVRGGWKHSDEFRAKMSARNKGKTLSESHKAKLSVARKGAVMDDGFRAKARARQLGVSPSDVTRSRLAEAVRAARAQECAVTEAKVREIYARATAGVKVCAACIEFGVPTTTFYAHCKRLGLPYTKQKRSVQ